MLPSPSPTVIGPEPPHDRGPFRWILRNQIRAVNDEPIPRRSGRQARRRRDQSDSPDRRRGLGSSRRASAPITSVSLSFVHFTSSLTVGLDSVAVLLGANRQRIATFFPPDHRSDCDAPDRHRIAQSRQRPFLVMAPPTIAPASISGSKPGPGQQGDVRRAAGALGAERAADRHPLTRPMSARTHLQRSDALSVI